MLRDRRSRHRHVFASRAVYARRRVRHQPAGRAQMFPSPHPGTLRTTGGRARWMRSWAGTRAACFRQAYVLLSRVGGLRERRGAARCARRACAAPPAGLAPCRTAAGRDQWIRIDLPQSALAACTRLETGPQVCGAAGGRGIHTSYIRM